MLFASICRALASRRRRQPSLSDAQLQELKAMITKPYQDVIDEINGLKAELPDVVKQAVADAEATKDQDAADGLAGITSAANDFADSIRAAAKPSTSTPALGDSLNGGQGNDGIAASDVGSLNDVLGGQADTTVYPAS